MPKYIYTAKTKDSHTLKDIEQASSREELVAKLRARGLFLISLVEVVNRSREAKTNKGGKQAKRSSVQLEDLTFLARNLAVTLSSGITLLRSLEILSTQAQSAKLGKILNECSGYVRGGLSFSEAINKYPGVFSNLWQSIVEVGEASGNLPFGLEKLADYLEMRMEFERKIKGAMMYPGILCCVCGVALFVFFKFILPRFTELFTQFNIDLPLPTKIVFAMSVFFGKYWWLMILAVAGIIFTFGYFRNNVEFRKRMDDISLKLPLLGSLVTLLCMERFTSTMYILLDSGLPLVYTLEASAKSIDSISIQKDLVMVKEKVRQGATLSDELRKLDAFPPLIAEMAKVGEETGTLPAVFHKVATYYQKELISRVERMVTLFEPLMIVVMGTLIGGIVISLFLPIFKIATLSN
jgi:type IV pilus assembly protein PilC